MATEQMDQLLERVTALWDELRRREPGELAARTGTSYVPTGAESGAFHFPMWGETVSLSFPGFDARWQRLGTQVDNFNQALLAYYFHTADGTLPGGGWIAFSELPNGTFYTQAFQGYTGQRLMRHFGNDLAAFRNAARHAGGRELELGDSGFAFQVLPRVALATVAWMGDEDFPPSYRLLFDDTAGHYLTTDACAVVGSALTKRILTGAETVETVVAND
jgi:hypothetical protein